MKTLTVDDRQRVRLPQVKPGQVFAYEPDTDGSIKLVPVITKPGPKRVVAKLVKRGDGVFFRVQAAAIARLVPIAGVGEARGVAIVADRQDLTKIRRRNHRAYL